MRRFTNLLRHSRSCPSKVILVVVIVLSMEQRSQADLISSLEIAPSSTIRHDRSDALYTAGAAFFSVTGQLTWPGFPCSGNFIGNFGGNLATEKRRICSH